MRFSQVNRHLVGQKAHLAVLPLLGALEVRTRHDCDGRTVDKVFTTIRIGALNGQ